MTLLQKTEPAWNYKTEEKQKGKNKNTHNTNVSLLVILQRLIRNCKNITPLFRFSTCHGSKDGSRMGTALFFPGEALRGGRQKKQIFQLNNQRADCLLEFSVPRSDRFRHDPRRIGQIVRLPLRGKQRSTRSCWSRKTMLPRSGMSLNSSHLRAASRFSAKSGLPQVPHTPAKGGKWCDCPACSAGRKIFGNTALLARSENSRHAFFPRRCGCRQFPVCGKRCSLPSARMSAFVRSSSA